MSDIDKKEIWKDIEGFEGHYQISNLSNVKSMSRVIRRGGIKGDARLNEKILKQSVNRNGYAFVTLSLNGVREIFYIHRLIVVIFLTKVNGKTDVNHIDGIKINNFPSNLEWCTRSENVKHAYKIGLASNRGVNHPRATVSELQVVAIKVWIDSGFTMAAIARAFNCNYGIVTHIKYGRAWSHIDVNRYLYG